MTNFKTEILNEIKETLSSSSIHSFPNIVQNRFKTIKIVWAGCFIVSAAACAFFITTTISEYLEFESVSKSTVKYVPKIDFPIITLCHTYPFATEYANEIIMNKVKLNFSDFDFSKSQNQIKYQFLAKKFFALAYGKDFNETYQKKFSKNLDYLIITCFFNVIECNLTQDFEYYYDYNYGNCFRYNSGKNMLGETNEKKEISTNAIENCFQLELFIGRTDQSNNILSTDNGVNLFIEYERIDSLTSEGIRISPGTSNYISFSKNSMTHFPKPYSDCTSGLDQLESSDNIYFRKIIENNESYTESKCHLICFQKYLGDKCKCQDTFTFLFYNDLPFCYLNETDFKCQEVEFVSFSKLGLFKDCDCPIRCEKIFYSFKISNSEYPTRYYAEFLSQNKNLTKKYNFSDEFNYEDYRNKLAEIKIFYEELKETIVEHQPKTTAVDLISNIGGTLGIA